MTQVIVRSSANVSAGGKSKLATIIHGLLLLLSVFFIPTLINLIPLASLAAILIMVGYKLAQVQLFKYMFRSGYEQFVPFVATIVGVLLTDLLKGIFIGIGVAVFYILRRNFRHSYTITDTDKGEINLELAEDVTFLNKASIVQYFYDAPEGVTMTIDGSKCKSINHDVLESIAEFKKFGAPEKKIKLSVINIPDCEIS